MEETPLTKSQKKKMVKDVARHSPLPSLARLPQNLTQGNTVRQFPVETLQATTPDKTEVQQPIVKLGFSVKARGEKALEKVAELTSRQAALELGTTPRQIRRARSGQRSALSALATHVSVQDVIEEAKATLRRMRGQRAKSEAVTAPVSGD